MTDEELHALARAEAERLVSPDRKQLRFNEIVQAARAFYSDAAAGVRELVASCDKACPALHVPGRPMWDVLQREYRWMA